MRPRRVRNPIKATAREPINRPDTYERFPKSCQILNCEQQPTHTYGPPAPLSQSGRISGPMQCCGSTEGAHCSHPNQSLHFAALPPKPPFLKGQRRLGSEARDRKDSTGKQRIAGGVSCASKGSLVWRSPCIRTRAIRTLARFCPITLSVHREFAPTSLSEACSQASRPCPFPKRAAFRPAPAAPRVQRRPHTARPRLAR
jgi:hypothetical protein